MAILLIAISVCYEKNEPVGLTISSTDPVNKIKVLSGTRFLHRG